MAQTLLDVARGDVSQEQIERAVADALRRGLVRAGRLIPLVRADPTLRRLALVLNKDKARSS